MIGFLRASATTLATALLAIVILPQSQALRIVASDDSSQAVYTGSWTTGDDGGYGFAGSDAERDLFYNSFEICVIPEPSAISLPGIGGVLAGGGLPASRPALAAGQGQREFGIRPDLGRQPDL